MAIRRKLLLTAATAMAGIALYVHLVHGLPATLPYIVVILLAYAASSARWVWIMAGLCTVLAVAGAFLQQVTPSPSEIWIKALFALWLPAIPCARALSERAERQRLSSLIHWSGDAISSRNLEGLVTSWNRGAEALYGYSSEEMIGREHSTLIPDGRLSELSDTLEKLRRGESVVQLDTLRKHKDGRLIDVSITVSPMQTTDGRLVGVSTIARDLTERKRLLEAERRLNEELEQRVRERTSEWERANEALERSNAELRQFAYVASHDLQTPLRSIAGFAQFLQEDYRDQLDETAKDYIDRIVRGAMRMHVLIHDLLELSRVEARLPNWEDVDLEEVCREVVELLRAPLEESGGEVRYSGLPRVRGDRSQLVQLLQNLVDNALKYRSNVAPVVSISAVREGRHWRIAVQDNGIGVASEHRTKIFEIFRRLHSVDSYPGTGIGLAICLRIVRRHGGQIWVEEGESGGCLFQFTLPSAPPRERMKGHQGVSAETSHPSPSLVGEQR